MNPRPVFPERSEGLAVRVYRGLLWMVLPRHVRGRFMSDAVDVFAEVARDARAAGWLMPWLALGAELPGIVRLTIARRVATPRDLYFPVVEEQSVTSSFRQDIRYATRAIVNAPVFSAVVVLTLGLGIAANTAIFSVLSGVLLKPLAVPEPERLVALGEGGPNSSPTNYGSTSAYNFYAWAEASKTMKIAAIAGAPMTLTGQGEPVRLNGTGVLGDFLGMIGARPAMGRFILPSDQSTEAERVVVLSHALWKKQFGGDPDIVGKSITLNNAPRRIVGVMPASFRYPDGGADYWLPLRLSTEDRINHDQYFIQPIGRLKDGITIEQAAAEMAVVAARLKRDWPVFNANLRIVIFPVLETTVSGVRNRLYMLMSAVAFVLLITCANLGNLLMARASARRRELAVRQALGAGQRRIAQQLLTESMMLSMLGAAVGLFLGKAFLRMILAAQETLNLPRINEIALDVRVLAFTLGVGVLAGVFFGTFPIWELRKSKFAALRASDRSVAGGRSVRDLLVISQLAFAMVLLTGAGLLFRSFQNLHNVYPGFSAPQSQLLTFSATADSAYLGRALERLRAMPGVRSASMIGQLPVTGRGGGAWFNRLDRTLPPGETPQGEIYRVVTPDIFSTLGIRIQRGRALDPTDHRGNPVVVVNAALARKYYSNEDALGKKIYLGAPDNRIIDNATIVGISDDTRDGGMATDPLPIVYVANVYAPWQTNMSFVIRTDGDAEALAAPVLAAMKEVDPKVTIRSVRTMADVVSASLAPARWSTTLVSVFAAVALIISLVGIFGVLTFIVSQRRREIGIRLALGASSGGVQRLVVGRAVVLAGAGLAVGTTGAVYLTRLMTSLLFGVEPADPKTMAAVGLGLWTMAVLASYVPARRATRIDPLIALKSD